jgi:hypothetical protein
MTADQPPATDVNGVIDAQKRSGYRRAVGVWLLTCSRHWPGQPLVCGKWAYFRLAPGRLRTTVNPLDRARRQWQRGRERPDRKATPGAASSITPTVSRHLAARMLECNILL